VIDEALTVRETSASRPQGTPAEDPMRPRRKLPRSGFSSKIPYWNHSEVAFHRSGDYACRIWCLGLASVAMLTTRKAAPNCWS